MDMARAKAVSDGGYNFVSAKIAISDRQFPITGNADERATS